MALYLRMYRGREVGHCTVKRLPQAHNNVKKEWEKATWRDGTKKEWKRGGSVFLDTLGSWQGHLIHLYKNFQINMKGNNT